jgi:enamine deaminase RidA (YjgF/YER057c/UK114 family)
LLETLFTLITEQTTCKMQTLLAFVGAVGANMIGLVIIHSFLMKVIKLVQHISNDASLHFTSHLLEKLSDVTCKFYPIWNMILVVWS